MKVKLESIVSMSELEFKYSEIPAYLLHYNISVGTCQWLFNLGLHISVSRRNGSPCHSLIQNTGTVHWIN